jgi:hypothetical protein
VLFLVCLSFFLAFRFLSFLRACLMHAAW